MRLLILEDDEHLREALARGFRNRRFAVDTAGTVHEARELLREFAEAYDGAILDLRLPDGSPLELLEECAADGLPLNAMVLSAHGTPDDRVAALKAGALDFVTKPVRMKELGLRVQHLVSRRPVRSIAVPIRVGEVTFDLARNVVAVGGEPIRLTPTQLRVFSYLMVNLDRSVSVQELIEHCWDRNTDVLSNPVHSQVSRLRAIFRGELLFVHEYGGYRIEVFRSRKRRPSR